jgi:hypothetical protein
MRAWVNTYENGQNGTSDAKAGFAHAAALVVFVVELKKSAMQVEA